MTHAVLFEFFFVVNARADYLSIFLGVSRNNATRAVTLSEFLLPGSETLCDLINSLFVRIELHSSFLCIPSGPTFYLLGLFVNVHEVTVPYSRSKKRKITRTLCYIIIPLR